MQTTTLVALYFFSARTRQSTASAIPGTSVIDVKRKDTARKRRHSKRNHDRAHDWRAQIFFQTKIWQGNCLWVISSIVIVSSIHLSEN